MKCVVLAGGSGDRLWPLSRKNYPKQFIYIRENRSLFQETIARNIPFCDEFYIVTSWKYENIVEGQLQAFQRLRYRCFYEEEGKKTAPAVAFACLLTEPSEDFLVVSTDHIITGGDYKGAVSKARRQVQKGKLACLGVTASSFEAGYGYFRQQGGRTRFFHCEENGGIPAGEEWSCDTGILVFNGGDYLSELAHTCPELYARVQDCAAKLDLSYHNIYIPKELVRDIEPVSIGPALISASRRIQVVEGHFDWRRIMTLESLAGFGGRADSGDAIQNRCENVSVLNSAQGKLVVANALRDLLVVNTPDAVYISPKRRTEEIKSVIRENYKSFRPYFDEGNIYYTPWGIRETLYSSKDYQVRKITLFPGKELPLHVHQEKTEHWSVVSGCAAVQLGAETGERTAGESVFVPAGMPHRIVNRAVDRLTVIEISIGEPEYEYGNSPDDAEGKIASCDICDDLVRRDADSFRTMDCKYFSVERWELRGETTFVIDDSSFRAFVVLEGCGTVQAGETALSFAPADCFFTPAGEQSVTFRGNGVLLKVQV